MQDNRVGVGLIGCGTISGIYLTNMTQHYHNLDVIACADMYMEKAVQTKEAYGLKRACTVDELLADPSIDIVVNLTIPAAHHEINMKALRAGKNVYCEKPLALSLGEANESVGLAREQGLILGAAPDTFLGAGIQTCRKLIDEGAIGDIVDFTANCVSPGFELWHPAPDFYYKKGAGPMMDMGPYYLTALVTLLGPVKRISCFAKASSAQRAIQGRQVDIEIFTSYVATVEMVSGVIGNINMSWDAWHSGLPCLEIYGRGGMLSVPDPNMFGGPVEIFTPEETIAKANEGKTPVEKIMGMISVSNNTREAPLRYPVDDAPRCNMRGFGVSDMASALLNGRPSRVNAELSRHVTEVLSSFDICAKQGVIYDVQTSCERPEPLPTGLPLWAVD